MESQRSIPQSNIVLRAIRRHRYAFSADLAKNISPKWTRFTIAMVAKKGRSLHKLIFMSNVMYAAGLRNSAILDTSACLSIGTEMTLFGFHLADTIIG